MPPHRMHLKGPWETVPLRANSEEHPLPSPETKKLPASWQALFGEFAGTVSFRRYFQKPTNLDANERVFVVFDGLTGTVEQVAVNGVTLSPAAEGESPCPGGFDVTEVLVQRNQLCVDLHFVPATTDGSGGLWGPVALEIHQV